MANKHISYKTSGTCSKLIEEDVDENGILQNVSFLGGCDGNLKGICALTRGMHIDDVKKALNGIRCGSKMTSCPDQLCRALEQFND